MTRLLAIAATAAVAWLAIIRFARWFDDALDGIPTEEEP